MRKLITVAFAVLVASVVADVRVQLRLKRVSSEDAIEADFRARSTPGGAKYQQAMNLAELTELVSAKPEAIAAVEKYFGAAAGVTDRRLFNTRDTFSAVVSREAPIAARLGLTAAMFEKSPVRHVATVPAELAEHVESITVVPPVDKKMAAAMRPEHHYSNTKKGQKDKNLKYQFPGMAQTPDTIKARYNIPNETLPASAVQGVAEFQDSYFQQSWISTFSQRYGLPDVQVRVSGPNQQSEDDVEGTLDLEYITGVAPGATTWWVSANSTNPDPFGIDFAYWCDQVLSLSPMPTVVSISWGIGENNYKGKESVLDTDNDAFRKLGQMGVTVFAASGDTGPGSRGFISCTRFDPSWPASSPYLTSVGATYATSMDASEVSVSFSGGGFSDYFGTPSWQAQAVNNYLSTASGVPADSYFNRSGRAFPDVAALGTNFMVYGQGQFQEGWMPVSGTSCASPTFAAVITRINAARVAAGKSTLGFLNPTIYHIGQVGFDVLEGKSEDPDCFGINYPGFPAATGWDPISGLGTPDYAHLHAKLV